MRSGNASKNNHKINNGENMENKKRTLDASTLFYAFLFCYLSTSSKTILWISAGL